MRGRGGVNKVKDFKVEKLTFTNKIEVLIVNQLSYLLHSVFVFICHSFSNQMSTFTLSVLTYQENTIFFKKNFIFF